MNLIMFYPITIALFAPTLKQAQDVSIDIAKQNSDEATRIIKEARLVSFKDGTHIRYGSQFDSPEIWRGMRVDQIFLYAGADIPYELYSTLLAYSCVPEQFVIQYID